MSRLCKETFWFLAMAAFLVWALVVAAWATVVQGKSAQEQEPLL